MTPQEFKAWFDGFTDAMDKAPDKRQWEKIKARVAEIDGSPVTYPVYVDRYWSPRPYHYPYYNPYGSGIGTVWSNLSAGTNASAANLRASLNGAASQLFSSPNTQINATPNLQYSEGVNALNFDSMSAMYAAGKSDAAAMAA